LLQEPVNDEPVDLRGLIDLNFVDSPDVWYGEEHTYDDAK
jgi:hypothetical protein